MAVACRYVRPLHLSEEDKDGGGVGGGDPPLLPLLLLKAFAMAPSFAAALLLLLPPPLPSPYIGSFMSGRPTLFAATRIWCVRPVYGRNSSRVLGIGGAWGEDDDDDDDGGGSRSPFRAPSPLVKNLVLA